MTGIPDIWPVCLAISLLYLPFQGCRELAGVTATGILPHQGQSQPRGLHALLQVRPGLGARAGTGGLWGFLGGASGASYNNFSVSNQCEGLARYN